MSRGLKARTRKKEASGLEALKANPDSDKKKYYVERKIGKNLRKIMANSLVKTHYEAFKEFVSNSYDADAQNVYITVDEAKDTIIIEDDGSGMGEDGLEGFIRMGDSSKESEPVSPKGRQRIGKFGIATVLLEYLADSYTLETWRDGTKLTLSEDFKKHHDDSKPLEYLVEDKTDFADAKIQKTKATGTRITLKRLNFGDERTFSLKTLMNVLALEMPLLPDFKITVNGVELKREKSKPTTSYEIDANLEHAGRLSGKLSYFKNGAENPGIFIYVRGRAVGDRDFFDIARLSRNLVGKVTGEIIADGLHQYISFDRSRFQEGNPAVEEMIAEIRAHLRVLKNEVDSIYREERVERIQQAVPEAIRDANESARRFSIRKINIKHRSSESLKENIAKAKSGSKSSPDFEIVETDEVHGLATYDPKSNKVAINGKHPFFQMMEVAKSKHNYLFLQFLFAASSGIAENLVEKQAQRNAAWILELLAARNQEIESLGRKVYGVPEGILGFMQKDGICYDMKINPFRVYSINEVQHNSGVPWFLLRKMISAGVVVPRKEEMFLGTEVIEGFRRIPPGYTAACMIVKDFEEQRDRTRQNAEQIYSGIDGKIARYAEQIEYIVNIGIKEPLFYIADECRQKFLTLHAEGLFRKGKYKINTLPAKLVKREEEVEDAYVTLLTAERVLDTGLAGLLELFDKAVQYGYKIRAHRESGIERYHIIDLKNVMQSEGKKEYYAKRRKGEKWKAGLGKL